VQHHDDDDVNTIHPSYNMKNLDNLVYSSTLFVGNPSQGSSSGQFIYDTSSGFVAVSGRACASCNTPYYNPHSSSTSETGAVDYDTQSLTYGSAKLYGEMYTDKVCMVIGNEKTCVEDFGFFMIKA
jgi:hypothetical protein